MMTNKYVLYFSVVLILIGVISSLLLLVKLYNKKIERTSHKYLILILFGVVLWGVVSIIGGLTVNHSIDLMVDKIVHIAIPFVVIPWFAFTYNYSGVFASLNKKAFASLWVPAIVFIFFVLTNEFHYLFWASYTKSSGSLTAEPGIVFWIQSIYMYLLILGGIALIIRETIVREGLYRVQSILLLFSSVPPLIANAYYLIYGAPIDPTPVTFAFTGFGLYIATQKYQLLSIKPVARDLMVDKIGSGILIVDNNNRVVSLNKKMKELVEKNRSETIGSDLSSVLEDIGTEYSELQALRDEPILDIENGEVKHFNVEVEEVYDSKDRKIGTLILFDDVTRIMETKKELEEFSSIVSHDLRNPISAAKGYVQLAQDEEDFSHLSESIESFERAEEIIHNTRTMIKQQKDVENMESLRLEDVVIDSLSNIQTNGSEIEFTDGASNSVIMGDKGRLMSLFENILSNSINHNDSSVKIKIGVINDGFYIEDNGVGFEDVEKVFEKGYTTSNDGTGLGLSIVKKVCKGHGWDIEAFNSDEGGAKFVIRGVDIENN